MPCKYMYDCDDMRVHGTLMCGAVGILNIDFAYAAYSSVKKELRSGIIMLEGGF